MGYISVSTIDLLGPQGCSCRILLLIQVFLLLEQVFVFLEEVERLKVCALSRYILVEARQTRPFVGDSLIVSDRMLWEFHLETQGPVNDLFCK